MADSASASTLVASFIAAGIPKAKAESTAKNGKLAAILGQIINDNDIVDATKNPKQGNLLLHLAAQEQLERSDSDLLARAIHDGRLQSLDQVNGEADQSPCVDLTGADLAVTRYTLPYQLVFLI